MNTLFQTLTSNSDHMLPAVFYGAAGLLNALPCLQGIVRRLKDDAIFFNPGLSIDSRIFLSLRRAILSNNRRRELMMMKN